MFSSIPFVLHKFMAKILDEMNQVSPDNFTYSSFKNNPLYYCDSLTVYITFT